jgi:hypothetical protein
LSTVRNISTSILLVALLAAPRVSAQEPARDDEPQAAGAPPPAKDEPAAKKKPDQSKIVVNGRIFVRETYGHEGDGDWGAQTSIASARLGARYRWKMLRARLELEFHKTAKLRSAYLELEPSPEVAVRAGLFKIPLSPLELTSSWVLPLADRGLLSVILRDRLEVAGRRVGATATWTPGAAEAEDHRWRIRASAGYFQGLDDSGELLDAAAAEGFGKVGAARLELGPFGVTGEIRQGEPVLMGPIRTAWAASADATLAGAGARLWLEVLVGSSWLVAEPTRQDAFVLEARAVAAWRCGGAKAGAVYLEPYVMAGMIDPDRELADDLVLEGTGGINVGMWKRWRLQVELEVWRFGKNVPFGFVIPAVAPVDRTAVVTQLGAAF